MFFVVLSSGLCCTAFVKSLAALDVFDLNTVHNLSSYEMAEPGFEPGALGAKREHYPLCYAAPLAPCCSNSVFKWELV